MSLRSAVRFVFNTSLTSVMFSCSVAINKHCLSVWALQETSVSCCDTNLHGLPLRRFTVVSRMVTFPDGFFPGKTFPGKSFPGWSLSRKDVSRMVIFPDETISYD